MNAQFVTWDTAKKSLQKAPVPTNLTELRCQQIVSQVCKIPWEDIMDMRRVWEEVEARHLYIYLLRSKLGYSKQAVAQIFGQHRTTIIYAEKQMRMKLNAKGSSWSKFQDKFRAVETLSIHP